MLQLDLQNNGQYKRGLNWNFFRLIIIVGFVNKNTTHLVRKYLPTIQSKPTTSEAIAKTKVDKWIAKTFFKSYKEYRKAKSEWALAPIF